MIRFRFGGSHRLMRFHVPYSNVYYMYVSYLLGIKDLELEFTFLVILNTYLLELEIFENSVSFRVPCSIQP